jgi:hypothetical protein
MAGITGLELLDSDVTVLRDYMYVFPSTFRSQMFESQHGVPPTHLA